MEHTSPLHSSSSFSRNSSQEKRQQKMNDFEGNFMDMLSGWDPLASPSPRTIFTMLNQIDNDQNAMTEIFSQSNIPRDQPKQRSGGFGQRLAARIDFQLPTLDRENFPISPEFNPPALFDYSQVLPSDPVTTDGPPNMVEGLDDGHAATIGSNNDLPDHQLMLVDMPPQQEPIDAPLGASFESKVIEEVDGNISMYVETEADENVLVDVDNDEVKDEVKDEDRHVANVDEGEKNDENHDIVVDENEHKDNDPNIVDALEVAEPSTIRKRRKYEYASDMVGATRSSKQQRIILQMECEEDNPDDGYRWRKYGQKVVKGNQNPRSYYKCTYGSCSVKKHVERGANNVKLLVTTYDGKHEHELPPPQGSGPKNRNGSSHNNPNQITHRVGRSHSASLLPRGTRAAFTSVVPTPNMTMLFLTGLPKLPSLPVNLRHRNGQAIMRRNDQSFNPNMGFVHRNDQLANYNPSYMHQSNQMVNQNLDFNRSYQMVNQNPSYMSQNDHQLINHYPSAMYRNGQLDNQSSSYMWRNAQPNNVMGNGVGVYMG